VEGNHDLALSKGFPESAPHLPKASPGQLLPAGETARYVLSAPVGSVLALGGIDGESLRLLLDEIDPVPLGQRALFGRIDAGPTVEAIVEQVIQLLAETARRLWPIWFTDTSFSECRNDTLGRLAAGAIARSAREGIPGLLPSWAEAAVRLTLDNRPPRVSGTPPAIELAQLALTISRSSLVLVAHVSADALTWPNPAAVVHALEWIAQHSHSAMIVLFIKLPPNEPPFDRILYGAKQVVPEVGVIQPDTIEAADHETWIAPWRGQPHPLSDIEQRLAKMIAQDKEMAPLFSFNQIIETVCGSRPRVDLVWPDGRLVVELDGYPDHGSRRAFMHDRHRDNELILSGYTVLRLANDEIAQDAEKALEKIRDVAKLCRMRGRLEDQNG
jgi:very-short-patch-repair endonuclease